MIQGVQLWNVWKFWKCLFPSAFSSWLLSGGVHVLCMYVCTQHVHMHTTGSMARRFWWVLVVYNNNNNNNNWMYLFLMVLGVYYICGTYIVRVYLVIISDTFIWYMYCINDIWDNVFTDGICWYLFGVDQLLFLSLINC